MVRIDGIVMVVAVVIQVIKGGEAVHWSSVPVDVPLGPLVLDPRAEPNFLGVGDRVKRGDWVLLGGYMGRG